MAPDAGPGPLAPGGPPPGFPPGQRGPAYPTPPAQKKSLVGLWVALAVVAVVVIATVVTLLVVQPWSGDEGGQDRQAGADDTAGTAGTTGTTGTTGATGPTPDAVVRGDLDGDGLGDVLGRYYDQTENRLTLTNSDGRFERTQSPVQEEQQLVVADFDGDHVGDIASWFDAGGALQVDVEGSDLGQTQDFELWSEVDAIKAAFGDVDGDGLTDVVAYGQVRRSQVAVWLMRNNGDGFEAPERWASLPNATFGSTTLVTGDFDGDGSDDAMAVVPDQPLTRDEYDDTYWSGDFGVVPLLSSAGQFYRGGIAPFEGFAYGPDDFAVGDFDGDGTDTIVVDDLTGSALEFYDFDGTTLRPAGLSVPYGVVGEGLLDAVAAVDVDGNNLDDLVLTVVDIDDYSFSGAWVAVADAEGGMDTPVKWADIPPCSGDYCEVDYYPAY